MIIAVAIIIVVAWRTNAEVVPTHFKAGRTEYSPLQAELKKLIIRPDRCRVALHGAVPEPSPARLLCCPRSRSGARAIFNTLAGSQPDVRPELLGLWTASCGGDRSPSVAAADRTRARPRHHDGGCAARAAVCPPLYQSLTSIWSRSIRCCATAKSTLAGCAIVPGTAPRRRARRSFVFSPTSFRGLPIHVVKREAGWPLARGRNRRQWPPEKKPLPSAGGSAPP